MKVGILTYHDALSYGARLQTLALQECIRHLGHEVSIIDYRGNVHKPMHWYDVLRAHSPWGLVSRFNQYNTDRAFRGFNQKFYRLSAPCLTEEELRSVTQGLDAIVVGSDQVWQLRNFREGRRFDPNYFLHFVQKPVRRVAYAASFGHDLPLARIGEELDDIKKFDFLSIREGKAASELAALLKREVSHACDPTLLWGREGFDSLLPRIEGEPRNVFYFSLSSQGKRDGEIIDTACRLFREDVVLESRPLRICLKGRNFIGNPIQWINAIRSARFVLTNSFHGTVFSILYHRPFLFLPWTNEGQNVRIKELLNNLNLSNRIFTDAISAEQQADAMVAPIAWERVDDTLSRWRQASRDYLQHALA